MLRTVIFKRRRSLESLLVAIAAAVVIAACGGSSHTTTASSGTGSSGATSTAGHTTSASANVPTPPTTPPDTIQVSTPLTRKPPAGKTAIFLICQLSACTWYEQGARAAAAALHWNLKIETMSNSDPAASLSEAVAQKPNYIFLSGIPESVLKAPLAQAKAAGIKVFSAADPDPASAGGFAVQVGGTLVPDTKNITEWILKHSSGPAHILAVTIPSFPVLNGETDWMKANVSKLDPSATVGFLDTTVDDVGAGKVPSEIVGYLQAHPDTNYVFFTFSSLSVGVSQALKSAGLSKVKLTGCCGAAPEAQAVAEGQQTAWTIAPNPYSAWVAVDAMARVSVGMPLTQSYLNSVFGSPSWVVDSAAAANQYLKSTGYEWPGPTNYAQQFEKLWHVG